MVRKFVRKNKSSKHPNSNLSYFFNQDFLPPKNAPEILAPRFGCIGHVQQQKRPEVWRANDFFSKCTLPETNIFAPKNGWFPSSESPFPGGPYFQVRTVSFREGTLPKTHLSTSQEGLEFPIFLLDYPD